jgi:outer membrane protein assembly factor BamB
MCKYPSLLLVALLLHGCAGLDTLRDAYDGIGEYFGGKDNAEPPRELVEMENTVQMKLLWDASIGKGYQEQTINLVAAPTESAIYAADHRGEIHARNRLTGEKLWEVDSELAISAGPVVSDGKIVVGSRNAEVAAFNATDGALLWKTTVSSEVLALPRIADGIVVIRSSDGHISGLNMDNGATLWTHERSAPALSLRGHGSPLIVGDLLIDGYASGKLIALRLKDGRLEWEATVAIPHGRSEIERLLDLDSVPVVRGDTLYVSGYQAGVAAVSLKDGEVLWRQDKMSTYSALAANRRLLFLTDTNSDVWQLDMRDGGDLWRQTDLHQRRLTAPVLVKDYVVLGDFEGYLHVLSADDGSLKARIRIDKSPIEEPPSVFDDILYVYTAGGTLAAVAVD